MRSGAASRGDLGALAERVRPVTLRSEEQHLPVDAALRPLLPSGALRRGSTVAVGATPGVGGGTSLALALLAEASRAGSWVAAVGLPSLGLVAADELGLALERLVLVAAPERSAWGGVAAALVDGFDGLVLDTDSPIRPADARRLTARARERGTALVLLGSGWPERADVELRVVRARWEGIEAGHGHLQVRKVRVAAGGRRAGDRPRHLDLWLPGPGGRVGPASRPAPEQQPAPAPSDTPGDGRRERALRAVS